MLIRAVIWLAVFLIAMGQAATLLAADYDMRADNLRGGATMYYLLTGRAPFDAPDLRELFVKVTTDAPVPLRQLRSDVPARLSALVLQCLAKTPARRPSFYPELADALRPFLARDDRPAPLGTRILAAVLDSGVIIGVPVAFAIALLVDPLSGSPERTAHYAVWSWVVTFTYFLLLEGATRASLGKRLFGMRGGVGRRVGGFVAADESLRH